MAPRRFPPPWSVEDNGAAFIVKDHGGPKAHVRSQTSLSVYADKASLFGGSRFARS